MAAIAKEIVLVTGANSGIGFEIARQFLTRGSYHVFLSARSAQRGNAALEDLKSRNLPGSIEFMQLDLQSDEHIANAAAHIKQNHGKLDILVNNAAVALTSGGTERERIQNSFDINATGPYLLTKALVPLLRKSSNPRVINVSSGAGSIGRRLMVESPMYKIQSIPYRLSKSAMNMMSACQYIEYGLGVKQVDGEETEGEQTLKVFTYDPGFTVSNLGEYNKPEFGARSPEETVNSVMEVVDGKRDGDMGKFIHNSGGYPW